MEIKRPLLRRQHTIECCDTSRSDQQSLTRLRKMLSDVAAVAALTTLAITISNSPAIGESSGASTSDTAARTAQASISVGEAFSCAINGSTQVSCWGRNTYGNLGNATTSQSSSRVAVLATGQGPGGTALSGITAIDSRESFSCSLTSSGSVKCWGINWAGMLGDGSTTDRSTPVDVVGLTGVKEISVGNYHACALMLDTTVKCWGHNGSGQLGDGTTSDRLVPTAVVASGQGPGGTALAGITAVSAGGSHTCALSDSGGVKCWGGNQSGNLGDGTTNLRLTPVNVLATGQSSGGTAISGITAISAGAYFTTCSITSSQEMKCWGENGNGQLGDGTTTNRSVPVNVLLSGTTALSNVRTISAGSSHTCASSTSGGLRCWGWNFHGQLGDGTQTQRVNPVSVLQSTTEISGVTAVAAGSTHTCALTSSGTTKCWGQNGAGQLGNGTSTTRESLPVDVSSFSSFVPDTTPPSITINRAGTGALSRGQTESVTFQLSESSTNFSATDVTIMNATLSNFAGSGTSYSGTITPTADSSGTITIDVNAATFTDAANNSNAAASQLSISFNTMSPPPTATAGSTSSTTSPTATTTTTISNSTSNGLTPGSALTNRNGQSAVASQVIVRSDQSATRVIIAHDDGSELRVVRPSIESNDAFVFDRGSTFEVNGIGYRSGSTVEIWLNSTPVRIGTTIANSSGRFATSVQIPQGFEPGLHSLRVNGVTPQGDQVTRIGITVRRPFDSLPMTGSSHCQLITLSMILLCSGMYLLGRRKLSRN